MEVRVLPRMKQDETDRTERIIRMEKESNVYRTYVEILHRELISSLGCTDLIGVAYCAALARSTLGTLPERIIIEVSEKVYKNGRSIAVPGSGGKRGIEAAAAMGALCGDEEAGLEVLGNVLPEGIRQLDDYLAKTRIEVSVIDSPVALDMIVTVFAGSDWAKVRIANEHTNVVLVVHKSRILKEKGVTLSDLRDSMPDYSLLNIRDICDFARTCDLTDIKEVLDRQITLNTAISEEGLRNSYGPNFGRLLLKNRSDVRTRAIAAAAAASDARMNGCELPVVICSGSGNQGLTASIPVIKFAKDMRKDKNALLRALVISNLVTITIKKGAGQNHTYCGAVCAGTGAGAGIAFLNGADDAGIAETIANAMSIAPIVVCDGANPSCSSKIAEAADVGLLGYEMYHDGQILYGRPVPILEGIDQVIADFCNKNRISA